MIKKDIDYFQEALHTFNGGNWFNWKKYDNDGNKIPNSDRMQYQYIEITKDGATMPAEAEVNSKVEELKQVDLDKENLKASAKAKLIAGEPLTEAEADTLVI